MRRKNLSFRMVLAFLVVVTLLNYFRDGLSLPQIVSETLLWGQLLLGLLAIGFAVRAATKGTSHNS